jgi:DNA-binding transcriptional MerR regulator
MPYTIGEFARLLGQSTDTLRYYEKAGLIQPGRNPGNNYRQFSDAHAIRAMNLRLYRSLDMDLSGMRAITDGRTVREQNDDLKRERERIVAEIRELEHKAKRIEELELFYDLAERETGRVNEIVMEELHSLYVFGKGAHTGERALRVIQSWMRHLPYSFFSVGIDRESLLSEDEGLEIRLGVGIVERYRSEFELPLSPEVETFPAGLSVSMHLSSRNIFGLSKRDIAPLFEFVREKGWRVVSGATGRLFAEENLGGSPLYYFSIRVLVEPAP